MTVNNTIQIVLSELNAENLILQDELESAINLVSHSKEETVTKFQRIKEGLKNLAINDLSITKLTHLINNTPK